MNAVRDITILLMYRSPPHASLFDFFTHEEIHNELGTLSRGGNAQ